MTFEVLVEVRLKPGVADPQGVTIERALPALGFSGIGNVRMGKAIRLTVEARDRAEAEALVGDLCEKLLANPVIEETTVVASDGQEVR